MRLSTCTRLQFCNSLRLVLTLERATERGVGDFFGGEGFGREVEQGVHLCDGAVDSPAGAHFAPVEDEFSSWR